MKHIFLVGALILGLCAFNAKAQTSGIPVSVTATASDFHYLGTSNAATHTAETIDLMNLGTNKASILSVAAHQIVVPGANLSIFGAGAGFQPDISSLLKKTNIPVEQLTFAIDGFGGVASLPAGNSGAWEIRGDFGYALTPNVALTTGYAGGGMIGSHGFYEFSAGLTAFLNPSANPSAMVQKMIRKHNAAKAAAKMVQ